MSKISDKTDTFLLNYYIAIYHGVNFLSGHSIFL